MVTPIVCRAAFIIPYDEVLDILLSVKGQSFEYGFCLFWL